MASAPQANLPLFYKDLMPLNSRDHSKFKARSIDKAKWVVDHHAVPLTADEFTIASRDFPIVFSSGETTVPLALMGLNEGINVFFDDEGGMREECYVPAYVRRYPFLLAKLDSTSEQMSLCFDPASEIIGDYEEGNALFDGDQPSAHTQEVLRFCESFEDSGMRTQAMIEELNKADLLMDGEVAIQMNDTPDQPYVYRGFRMVNQEKLRDMRGDQLRTWNQNGLLPLIFAHLFSLDRMRIIFAKQTALGKGPGAAAPQQASTAPAPANA